MGNSINKFFRIVRSNRIVLSVVFIWVVFSGLLSLGVITLFRLLPWFEFSDDALSNIFGAIFSVLAGIGSIVITLIIYTDKVDNEKDKDKIREYALFEPRTVEEYILDELDTTHIVNEIVNDTNNEEKSYLISKGHRCFKFNLIDHRTNQKRFVYDIWRHQPGENPTWFVIDNKGTEKGLLKKGYILYKKEDVGNDCQKYKEEGGIKVPMQHLTYRFPHRDPVFINSDSKSKENTNAPNETDFYKQIENGNNEFLFVIEYETRGVARGETVMKAYRGKIGCYEDKNKKIWYIQSFDEMTQDNINSSIEEEFANKIIQYSKF